MAAMLLRLAFCGAFAAPVALADKVLLMKPPEGKSGDPAAWIVLPGAQIDYSTYRPLAEAVQQEASMPLWVAVLGTYFTPTPVPGEIGPRIDAVLRTMKGMGLDLSKVRLFYGGHSLGSVFIQDHLKSYHGSTGPLGGTINVLGQVLMGGFLQRKYTYPSLSYPVTTLTIGGELDGLARVTRLAEAFYVSRENASFPVAIVMGMTHMQFASGAPPALVKARDLQPEISMEAAHAAVAKFIAPYFANLCTLGASEGHGRTDVQRLLASRLAPTADFLRPIIAAYELEGSRNFNVPVQFGGPGQKLCSKGGCPGSSSHWPLRAQNIISNVEGWSLNISNEYVDCASTPLTGGAFHLPQITNDTLTKTISITTYSQAYWDDAQPSWFDWKEIFDKFDTGFIATSAEEIGTKLSSRQCSLMLGAGMANVSFSVDDPSFCKEANEEAYKWAQANAGSATKGRFDKYGQKFSFAEDIGVSGGPLFLDQHLRFTEVSDTKGEKVIEIASIMQKTEIDYWQRHFHVPRPHGIPDPGCFHYCKLLSPARAMEWIYVDSLRQKRSLSHSFQAAGVLVV